MDGTKLYDESSLADLPSPAAGHETAINVTAESTGEAIARLVREGKGDVGCLNFASAKNPGGGFLGGSQAQEECLARSSGLYPCLLAQRSYYDRNRDHRSAIYLDLLIYSPNVPFIRDDDGVLYERPALSSVVTCPAPNRGAVLNSQTQHKHEIIPAFERRARMVLKAAAVNGVKHLVLGAWGCGVFRNDPVQVAEIFAQALPGFTGVFAEVIFAIYDRAPDKSTVRAFEGAMKGLP